MSARTSNDILQNNWCDSSSMPLHDMTLSNDVKFRSIGWSRLIFWWYLPIIDYLFIIINDQRNYTENTPNLKSAIGLVMIKSGPCKYSGLSNSIIHLPSNTDQHVASSTSSSLITCWHRIPSFSGHFSLTRKVSVVAKEIFKNSSGFISLTSYIQH